MYNMGKIYTVSIGSGTRITGTTTTKADYNINWETVLPDNKSFKVGFSFISNTVNITSLTSIPIIAVDLGGANTHRINAVQGTYTNSSNTVGILSPHTLSTTTYLRGEAHSNNKSYIKSRPKHNVFNVLIFTTTGTEWTDNVGATIGNYVLILSFEEMDDE